MTLDGLPIHFATTQAAESIRADEAVRVREIRKPIANDVQLFDALAEALELPEDFGRNWDGLDECLRDVDPDIVLLVHQSARLWRQAPGIAAMLVDVWLSAASESKSDLHLVFVW
jgi:hypothetical protein